jgi:hypothetical protein
MNEESGRMLEDMISDYFRHPPQSTEKNNDKFISGDFHP